MTKTIQELHDYVQRTSEIDESGDATLSEFLLEHGTEQFPTSRELFIAFLVWANGEDWQQFLDHAKVGDIPK